MGILQAVSLVPARGDPKSEALTLARPDLLNLIADFSLPRTIKEARERREETAAYEQAATEIVKAHEAAVKAEQYDEQKAGQESSKIKDLLKLKVIKPVLSAAKYILRTAFTFIVRAASVILQAVVSVVRVIATLLMNPYVLGALAVVGIGILAYKYFTKDKNKDKNKEPPVRRNAPTQATYQEVTAATPAAQPTPSPKAESTVMPQQPQPKQAQQQQAKQAQQQQAKQAQPQSQPGPAKTAKAAMTKAQISESVASALQSASKRVAVPVNLLTAMAGVESSFNEGAKASTSSASGMFQFINSTWNSVVKKYWAKYGYPDRKPDRMRAEDSAILAAAMMKHEGYPAALKAAGSVSITDIYLTHFLGPGGGAAFIRNYQAKPNVEAATVTPDKVVKANMSIYYKGGQAQTFKQIYDSFSQKLAKFEAKTKDVVAGGSTATPPKKAEAVPQQAQSQQQQPAANQPGAQEYVYLPQGKGQPVVRAKA